MCIRDRGSTIRLSVFARRREIEIMKYVGATNGLVTSTGAVTLYTP